MKNNSTNILDGLNTAQQDIVSAPDGNMIVLAGAGSGKTKVLTHRIAWHLQDEQTRPENILAVTFTNKAAGEMRSRIEKLLGNPARGMWVGTFHGLANRLLRIHYEAAGLPSNFQIIDSDDQNRIVKKLIKEAGLNEKKYKHKDVQALINKYKENTWRPADLEKALDKDPDIDRRFLALYKQYHTLCDNEGLVDFAELLLRVHEMFKAHDDILERYRKRFDYILVDEFQDTNKLQYAWLRQLSSENNHTFAVGDDDQSIYSFRGARMEHMQQFQDEYNGATLYRLERNYRSTPTILNAANSVIDNNTNRLGKTLWADGEEGTQIIGYRAQDSDDEARYIASRIKAAKRQGTPYKDNVVLYRVSASSRAIEGALMNANIPYNVLGGLRFYERMEIKDTISYLRLIQFGDNSSFERIVNVPTRGIGKRTLGLLQDYAAENNISLLDAAARMVKEKKLTPKATQAIQEFLGVVNDIRKSIENKTLAGSIEYIIRKTKLKDFYLHRDGTEKAESRIENLDELVHAAGLFELDPEIHGDMDKMTAFLTQAALDAAGDKENNEGPNDYVSLMTVHVAKGLEFENVFMIAMEEGLFPHERSLYDPHQLEEERRLCYVGMTRAKQQLSLSCPKRSLKYGRGFQNVESSRFIDEVPDKCIDLDDWENDDDFDSEDDYDYGGRRRYSW